MQCCILGPQSPCLRWDLNHLALALITKDFVKAIAEKSVSSADSRITRVRHSNLLFLGSYQNAEAERTRRKQLLVSSGTGTTAENLYLQFLRCCLKSDLRNI